MSRLTFSYDHDSADGYGLTGVRYDSEDYRGKSSFWGVPGEFLPFAEQLTGYPIRPGAPAEYRSCPEEDPLVLLTVEPRGPLGHLDLYLVLTDCFDPRNRLSVCTPTTYVALQRLEQALRRLALAPYETETVELY